MPNEESYLDESLRKIAKTLFLFIKKKTCAKRKIGGSFGKAFLLKKRFCFIGAFIGLGIGYLSRMIIARVLGASDYGLISLGYAAMMIGATLALVGLPSGIQRFFSFYKGKGDKERIKGLITFQSICFVLAVNQ